MRAILAAGFALRVGVTPAGAQENESPIIFLERAYFTPASPFGKKLIFEGQPSAHYFLFNTFGDTGWQRHGGWGVAAPLSELFVFRMSGAASSPVLTPSYHIGLRIQVVHLWHDAASPLSFQMLHLMSGVMHYSNGQYGCTYLGFDRQPNGKCTMVDTALAQRSLANTTSGDFSTSYIPFAASYRWGALIPGSNTLKNQLTIGGEVQLHPTHGLPGAPELQQIAQYAQHEASGSLEWECRNKSQSGVWRLAGNWTTRFGGGAKAFSRGSSEISYIFEGAKIPPWRLGKHAITPPIRLHHSGFVARFNSGYDYYNIHFQERGSFWSLGVVLDPSRLDGLVEQKDMSAREVEVGNCLPW